MNPYHEFTARELAEDPYFRKWVLEPDNSSDHFWQGFLKAYPSREETVILAYELVQSDIDTSPSQPLTQTEKAELKRRIYRHLNLTAPERPFGRPTRNRHQRRLWLAAAASAALIGVFALWLLLANNTNNVLSYSAATGESRQIWLPDSTRIVLHANSTLTYPENFRREVRLRGEAYFDVVHQEKMPFTVHTDQLGVTVLGTEFHIKARNSEPEVALISGKVRVAIPGEKPGMDLDVVVLAPGEKARLSNHSGRLIRSEADTRLYTALAQGKWFFDEASLDEIAGLIKDYYDMEVVFENEGQRSLTMSAVIPLTNVDALANVIARTMNCSIRLTGDKLIIENLH